MLLRAARSRALQISAAILFALSIAPEASANSSGFPGRSTIGCGDCHSSPGNMATLTLSGPTALNPGQSGTYTLTATQSTVNNTVRMGLDVTSSDGVSSLAVIAGQCTNISGSDLVHNSGLAGCSTLKQGTNGTASYQFTYTMPGGAAAGSTHTLNAASAWGFGTVPGSRTTSATVTTRPGAPSTLTPSNTTSSSVQLAWTGGGPEYGVVYKTGATPPTNENDGTLVTFGAGTTSTTISGLNSATQYSFRLLSKLSSVAIYSTTGPTATITTTNPPAATRHVNAATGVDSGNCSSAGSPCKTITYAMGQAVAGNPGDVISVAPGTYNVALGEVFPITFKNGVQLVATGNPSNTFIDGAGDTVKKGLIKSQSNNSAAAKIEGFTFRNGLSHDFEGTCPSSLGGALNISSSSANFTVSRNVFDSNEARGHSPADGGVQAACLAWGGAIYVFSSAITIVNNVFTNNIARGGSGLSHPGTPLSGGENANSGEGGAIMAGGTGSIMNNTFRGNSAIGGNGGTASNGSGFRGSGTGGAISAGGNPAPIVANNIFAGNAATSGSGQTDLSDPSTAGAVTAPNSPSVRNNLLFGNLVNGVASPDDTVGTFAVTLDPLFHAPPGNLRLRNGSPARNAGTAVAGTANAPTIDLDGTTRPIPPSIGAFEASLVATTTTVISSVNPSGPGQSVTFTADVDTANNDTVNNSVTFKDGASVLCNAVALSSGTAQCTTASLSAGTHLITAEYSGSGNYAPSTSSILSQVVTSDPPRLANISTRGQVQTGFDVMIGGFVISGGVPKTVVIRAIGPSLVNFGIAGALPDPSLQLIRLSDNATVATNDNWQSHASAAQVQAAGFAPGHPLESAVYVTLSPGAYTAIVSGVGGSTGVGLVEVYEIDHPEVPLINISTRGKVQTGFDVMIGGFVVTGSGTQTLVIRAIGPSLANFGVTGALPNPTMQLVRISDNTVVASNDDWQSGPNAAQIQSAGFAPSNPLESAMMVTLGPGAYTAIVSGVGGTSGVGLVEVYKVVP